MSEQIQTELRTYMSYLDTQVAPMTIDEVTELRFGTESVRPIGPLSHPVDLGPHRRWLVAVAAAVVVLVLLGGLTLLSQVTDPDASVAGPVVPTTVTQPTQTTVAQGVSGDVPGCGVLSGWLQVCDAASFNGTAMYAVTAGGPGLVAVGANGLEYYTREGAADLGGYEGEAPVGTGDAVVWTSPDGFTWSRVPHDVATFGGDGGQQMFDVTVGGPGLVAVGRDGPVADGEGNAAVWTSRDGFTWSRVAHDEAVFGGEGEQRMVSVTAGGSGLVAVGFDRPAEQGEGNAVVWTSPDGFVWSRVPHDEAVFGGDSRQMMLSVTTGGPGLVAVGTDGYSYLGNEDPHTERPDELATVALASDAAVWTSPDGFTWSRVPHDEDVFATSGKQYPAGAHEEQMLSVTAGGPGLVAVGFDSVDDCGWDSAVWTSPDGLNWSRVPDERDCNGPYDRMLSVTVGSSGLVAVGEEHHPGAAAVWNG